ncbi:MAG: conjugal transfer protein TraK, partial [uncultured bacterium]
MLSVYLKKVSLLCVIGLSFLFLKSASALQVMAPTVISITQNAQINIDLSNTDINKIFVYGQKITAITKPDAIFNSNNDSSGNVYATISGDNPFTAFISTDQGLHFSLLITPKAEPGQTIEFQATGFSNQSQSQKNTTI